MSDAIRFIRKGGRVIPIRAAAVGAARGASVGIRAKRVAVGAALHGGIKKQPEVKVDKRLDALGFATAVASGVVGAATFTGGTKKFIGGLVAGHALDVGGFVANAASVAGPGKRKERLKQAAKQEGRNLLVGNAVFGVGLLASKANRQAVASGAKKVLGFARKVLRVP